MRKAKGIVAAVLLSAVFVLSSRAGEIVIPPCTTAADCSTPASAPVEPDPAAVIDAIVDSLNVVTSLF